MFPLNNLARKELTYDWCSASVNGASCYIEIGYNWSVMLYTYAYFSKPLNV